MFQLNRGEIILSKYRVIRHLGNGGTAAVYLVCEINTEKRYAAKCFSIRPTDKSPYADSVRLSFKRETEILSSTHSRGVPELKEVLQEKDRYYIIMEHVQGEKLTAYMKARQSKKDELLSLMLQTAMIINALNQLSVPHYYMDLKPSNLIVKPDGTVKLLDYGAVFIEKEKRMLMGTPKYAHPDLISGKKEPSVQTDLYSFGKCFLEIYTHSHIKSIRIKAVLKRCVQMKYRSFEDIRKALVKLY